MISSSLKQFMQLIYCYVMWFITRWSISSSVLAEYGFKWAPVSMIGTSSSVDKQNRNYFSLLKLMWKWGNEITDFFLKKTTGKTLSLLNIDPNGLKVSQNIYYGCNSIQIYDFSILLIYWLNHSNSFWMYEE